MAGGAGWIFGKAPRAFYAFQTDEKVPPEAGWMIQEHGKSPAPTVTLIEPLMAVEGYKAVGNTAFRAGRYEEAIEGYTAALALASTCDGAYGLDDELYGKLYGNRAEAHLQMNQYEHAKEDAGQAIEYDPTFTKAYVRRAKACAALELHEEAAQCLQDALDVSPKSKEVLSLQVSHTYLYPPYTGLPYRPVVPCLTGRV